MSNGMDWNCKFTSKKQKKKKIKTIQIERKIIKVH